MFSHMILLYSLLNCFMQEQFFN